MIDRYSLPAMKSIWEEENKYKTWLKIELLVCEALFELGKINKDDIENIKKKARYSIARIQTRLRKLKAYICRIEELTKAKVVIISVGPKRSQTIIREELFK